MRISDWSSDVCSSDLHLQDCGRHRPAAAGGDPQLGPLHDTAALPSESEEAGHRPSRGRLRRPLPRLRAGRALSLRPLAHLYARSEEHTSELQSLMRISYAVFCLKKKQNTLYLS